MGNGNLHEILLENKVFNLQNKEEEEAANSMDNFIFFINPAETHTRRKYINPNISEEKMVDL